MQDYQANAILMFHQAMRVLRPRVALLCQNGHISQVMNTEHDASIADVGKVNYNIGKLGFTFAP